VGAVLVAACDSRRSGDADTSAATASASPKAAGTQDIATDASSVDALAPEPDSAPPRARDAAAECPDEGDATDPNQRADNLLKNRTTTPSDGDIDPTVTLATLLAPGSDAERWSAQRAGEITGYVHDVKVGGVESVNCHAKRPQDRDTHIEIGLEPKSYDVTRRAIVEVTPRLRAEMQRKGIDWSTPALRSQFLGRWITVRGWLYFDRLHIDESEHTARGRPHNWRATAWEIHPITSITLATPR
jgi:hypothetical protein